MEEISKRFFQAGFLDTPLPTEDPFLDSWDRRFPQSFRDRQNNLSKIHLDPYLDDVRDFFERLRERVDKIICDSFTWEDFNKSYHPSSKKPGEYPQGFCREIRNAVFDLVEEGVENHPGAEVLKNFRKEKGFRGKIRGIVTFPEGGFFQNSMQWGNKIIDCAVDAGDSPVVNGKKVEIHSVNSETFVGIKSFLTQAEVAEEYWGYQAYSTEHIFPRLAPYVPVLFLRPDGGIEFEEAWSLFFKNICTGFQLSEEFLRSEYRTRQLPLRYRRYFSQRFGQEDSMFRYQEDGIDVQQLLRKWREKYKLFTEEGMSEAEKIEYWEQCQKLLKRLEREKREFYYDLTSDIGIVST